jgi:hypothetical protein
VSGEPVALLVSQPSGTLASLIRALADLETAGLPRHALIGGVAVMVRLSQAHRATQDLDEVVEPSSPTAAVLIAGPGAVEHRAETAGGVRIDLISVGDRDLRSLPASDLPDQDDERLFALAHDFALRSAEPALIRVMDPGGGVLVESTSPVATAAALFATKLQSAPRRSGPTQAKRGSDIYDAFLLLDQLGPVAVADALRKAPHDLATLTGDLAARLLGDEAERTLRWTTQAGVDSAAAGMTAAALRALAEELVAALRS